MRYFCLLLLLAPLAAQAQTKPAPIVLAPGSRLQRLGPGANRPDHLPEFPGGEEALGEFFAQNVKMPTKAKSKKITGSVVVTATVGADGRLTDPKISQSLSPDCDAEALRVVGLLPGWRPASRRGQPLPMLVQLPVPFEDARTVRFETDRHVPRSTKDAPGLN